MSSQSILCCKPPQTRFLIFSLACLCALFASSATLPAQTWTQTPAPNEAWMGLACSSDGTKLVASCWTGSSHVSVYTSTNSGATWLSNNVSAELGCSAVACSADGTRLAAGLICGGICTSSDGGATWIFHSVPVDSWSSIVCSTDGARLLAVGTGMVLASTNYGTAWEVVPAWDPWTVPGQVVACSNDMSTLFTAVAGIHPGPISVSKDFGVTWKSTTAPLTNWSSLACSADGTKIVAGAYDYNHFPNPGGVFLSRDSGTTWESVRAPELRWFADKISVTCSSDGNQLLVADYGFSPGMICTSTDFGNSWSSNAAPPGPWSEVAASADGSVRATAVYGEESSPARRL